jgi:acyl-CoA synthetase (NDP forming)
VIHVSTFADISRLVRPQRVAVVGASGRVGSLGHSTYLNVRDNSVVPGGTFPVNPRYDTVLGDTCHARVSDIPGDPVDVAIVLVAAELVPDVVEDCAASGVRHVMVLSSGFAETDGHGQHLQQRIVGTARNHGMHLYGPNSPGLANIADRVLLSMSPVAASDVTSGPVGLVTQGGGLGRAVMQWMDRGLGIGLWASPGNEADLDVADFINHMLDDDRIQVVGAVVEGFSAGRKFLDVARRAEEVGKPLVVLKIGRSMYGQQTAASHTASIAGDDEVASAVFEQYGVVRVDDVDELAETLLLFARASGVIARDVGRTCVYSFSGGTASLGADLVGSAGLELARFSPATAALLAERAPAFGFADNPVDLTTRVFTDADLNRAVFEAICADPQVGSIVFAMPADYGESTVAVTTDAVEIAKRNETLLVPVWMSPRRGGGYEVLERAGYAPFDGLSRAVSALSRVVRWQRRKVSGDWAARAAATVAPAAADEPEMADGARVMESRAVPYAAARDFLERHAIRFPAERFVTEADAAARAVEEIDRPVVMKLSAPGLIHKTEVGGVRLDVRGADAARSAYADLTSPERLRPFGVVADGVQVQEMVPAGLDLLLGAHNDAVFGPTLTLGTGGVETEIEHDVLHLAIPFTDEQLVRALGPLRLWRRLAGFRGASAYDVGALCAVAQAFASAFAAADELDEAEVNPLRLVARDGATACYALDVVLLGR